MQNSSGLLSLAGDEVDYAVGRLSADRQQRERHGSRGDGCSTGKSDGEGQKHAGQDGSSEKDQQQHRCDLVYTVNLHPVHACTLLT
jgi:hypothetical protein